MAKVGSFINTLLKAGATQQHLQTCYSTLQYITVHYSTTQYTTVHYSTTQYTTVHYNTLQYTTVHYITLRYTTVHYSTPQYTTVHHSTLQYTTVHTLCACHWRLVNHSIQRLLQKDNEFSYSTGHMSVPSGVLNSESGTSSLFCGNGAVSRETRSNVTHIHRRWLRDEWLIRRMSCYLLVAEF